MPIELTTEYYGRYLTDIQDKIANPWSLHGRHHKNLNRFVASSLEGLPAGSRILDAGCGLSIWVTPSLRQRFSMIGVDVQPDSIKACKALYPGCDYRLTDLYNLEFPDSEFDAVVMREVIEHFKTPERAVTEVQRVLKKGGLYVLTTPNYSNPLLHLVEQTFNRFFSSMKPYLEDVHPSKFHPRSLRALIAKYFSIEKFATVDLGINLACIARKL